MYTIEIYIFYFLVYAQTRAFAHKTCIYTIHMNLRHMEKRKYASTIKRTLVITYHIHSLNRFFRYTSYFHKYYIIKRRFMFFYVLHMTGQSHMQLHLEKFKIVKGKGILRKINNRDKIDLSLLDVDSEVKKSKDAKIFLRTRE